MERVDMAIGKEKRKNSKLKNIVILEIRGKERYEK